ncbi:hypothetical protein [Streptomyces melanogenes]|uniref:hypothetical protein n=1 Tax=Streptomyces melanogenes TaxID=67326 RepID=UPI0037BCA7E5
MSYVERVQKWGGRGMGGIAVSTGRTAERRVGRVLGRMGLCVLMYVGLHTVAWTAVILKADWEDSFSQKVHLAAGMLGFVGIPTLLIAILAVSVHRRMDVVRFRILLAMGLVPWVGLLLGASSAEPFVFQLMAQFAFAALIPAPLFPEDWEGGADR